MKTKKITSTTSFSEKIFTKDCFWDRVGFKEFLYQLMREKKLEASDVYKRAGLSRQTWHNVYSWTARICPTPETARHLVVGLKCTPKEAEVLLSFCGLKFVEGSVYDDCLLLCLKNQIDNMIDVSLYIDNYLSHAA